MSRQPPVHPGTVSARRRSRRESVIESSVRDPVRTWKVVLPAAALLCAAFLGHAEQAGLPAGVIQLDETVISGNQELPKVLYILPWRQPSGLPDIEVETKFAEMEVFRRLYPPAYRRELSYFESLDGNTQE